jgi:hypothetical protein
MPCGHNCCSLCFAKMRRKNCPTCQQSIGCCKEKFHVNLTIDNFLKSKIPNYGALKSKMERELKSLKIESDYRKSERYSAYRKIARSAVLNRFITLDELINKVKPTLDVEELKYIIDIDSQMFRIATNDGKDIIIHAESETAVLDFISKEKANIGPDTVIFLLDIHLGLEDDDVPHFYTAYYGKSVRKQLFYEEPPSQLLDYLSTQDLKEITRKAKYYPSSDELEDSESSDVEDSE